MLAGGSERDFGVDANPPKSSCYVSGLDSGPHDAVLAAL